jgi:long-subunit fatty acid transport protein
VRRWGVALALIACGVAHASTPDLFGLGARSGAMAGTGVADAVGYDACYLNPAGLVGPTRRRLTLGYLGAHFDVNMNGAHRPVDDSDGVLIAADIPLPFGGVLRDRLAIGVSFYYPVGLINRARDGFPDQPRLALLDDRSQVVSILLGLGARVHRRVSLGIGVLALAALVGTIAITPDAGGRITTVSEEQLVASFAPVAGVRVEAAPWLTLGAALRGESKSEYDIKVVNSLGTRLPIQLPTFRIAGTAQFDPLQVAVEGAFHATPWLTVDAGVTWKHWSAYGNPVQNATLGAPPQPPTRYHDTAVPRIAGEATARWGRLRLHGRAGYFYEWSPAPRDQTILIDADRHVVTAGGGLEWLGTLSVQLDLFGQLHALASSPRADGLIGVFGAALGVDL